MRRSLIMNYGSAVTYATLDPLNTSANWTLSGGNLICTGGDHIGGTTRANIAHSTGKYYFEFVWNTIYAGTCTVNSLLNAGISDSSFSVSGTTELGFDAAGNSYGWSAYGSGGFYFQGSIVRSSFGSCFCNAGYGITNMCAIDFDLGMIWFGQSGTWFASGNPAAGTNPANVGHLFTGSWYPAFFLYNSQSITINFGASAFTYSAPAGFNAGYF